MKALIIMAKRKAKKWVRIDHFKKGEIPFGIRMGKTGNEMPQPARIIVSFSYRGEVRGWRGWHQEIVFDRIFEDWRYAHAVYNEILRRGKHEKMRGEF